MKTLFWTIGMMSWATATGWAQCVLLEPRTGAYSVSAFPAVKLLIKSRSFSGRAVIRLTHGPNYWTGAQWKQAEDRPLPGEVARPAARAQ